MDLIDLVTVSQAVGATRSRKQKAEHLAGLLARLDESEIEVAVSYLSGRMPQGRIGVGPAAVHKAIDQAPAEAPSLGLLEVHERLSAIKAVSGAGSKGRREALLFDLFARSTEAEQRFLGPLLAGGLRQGALDGVMVEGLARATDLPPAQVRRAHMLSGDLARTGHVALMEGADGLAQFKVEVFRPLSPMLAKTAEDPGDALETLEEAAFEYKLDGARIQVHKSEGDVRVFTRRLHDVTARVPEVVEAVQQTPARELILDGEVIALQADGRPYPFQTTMRRFGRKLDVERMRDELPLSMFFFDCLYRDGQSLIDEPARERTASMTDALGEALVVPRLVTGDADAADAFFARAIGEGHEGVMAKGLATPYEAGARGDTWLKIKPAHTLDLVVLAAEWGSGRREGWLSNLHLGARDPETGGFVMLGKTFKGLTDKLLTWQTEALLARETHRDAYVVHVRPELVVEIAFNDVQASPRYPGGLALRFARVKRYREDKTPLEADTIDTVRAIHAGPA
ncbi:MAG: ATP-dependent DNA ligase [Planctomycetota bacterium]|nr:ATP-dependent DNA ligase [Planctomycetota bacterium]